MATPFEDQLAATLAKLRGDFELVTERREQLGDWSKDDAKAIGEAIRLAIAAQDRDAVFHWALWLSDLAHTITAWDSVVCASMARCARQARIEANDRQANQSRNHRSR